MWAANWSHPILDPHGMHYSPWGLILLVLSKRDMPSLQGEVRCRKGEHDYALVLCVPLPRKRPLYGRPPDPVCSMKLARDQAWFPVPDV